MSNLLLLIFFFWCLLGLFVVAGVIIHMVGHIRHGDRLNTWEDKE